MGAPKQKWTPEEEAALKAGVSKHGAGKWRTILTDAEFSSILCLRSNVDLKDKWRNINVTAIWGSRQKAKLALRKNQPDPKPENNPLAVTVAVHNDDEEIVDANKPIDNSNVAIDETLKHDSPKQENVRLDKLILQAIASLKEPRGSDRSAIAMVIEGQYWTPPDLKKMLASKLKHMAANGKLIKMKHRYKIPPSSRGHEKRRSLSKLPIKEGTQNESPITPEVNILSRAKVDQDLETMRNMATAKEAAAAAAQAVAEAEAAMAAAEEAEREAEAAEAEAEAAQIFAKAAIKAFKSGLRIW